MSVYANDNGTLRNIARAFVNDNGVLREIRQFAANDNGVLHVAYLDQVAAPNVGVSAAEISPTDANAGFRMGADGHWYTSDTSVISYVDQGTWITPAARANAYEVRVTVTGGLAFDSGTAGAWLAMTVDRTWTQSVLTNGTDSDSTTFTIEIRRASDLVVVSTTTLNTLTAQVDV